MRPAESRSLGPAALATSFGVLLVAGSYALSRAGAPVPSLYYWVGVAAVFAPGALLAARGAVSDRELRVAVLLLAVATALIKVMYSPLRLEFPDELQHLRGTLDLLRVQRFGVPNPALQIAPAYPGLETVAAVVTRLTGLRIDLVGIALGAICHVAGTVLVAHCLRMVLPSARAALVATLVFSCNASFVFFNSLFIYENLGLLFGLAAVACLLAPMTDGRVTWPRFAGAFAAGAGTLVTHHVTAFFLIAAMAAVAGYLRLHGMRTASVRALVVTGVMAAAEAVYLTVAAPQTVSYLRSPTRPPVPVRPQPGRNLVYPQSPPTWEYALAGAGLLVLLAAALGAVVVARKRRQRRWLVTAFIGVAALGATELIRLVSGRGGELAGRASPFLYIGVALAVAYLAVSRADGHGARPQRWVARWVALLLTVAFLGGVCAAWPIWWDRLPGDQLVATSFERGVDAQGIAAAEWIRRHLPRNALVAGDANALVEIGTRGLRTAVSSPAEVFYSRTVTAADARLLRDRGIGWIWVNTALSRAPSPDGLYFGDQTSFGKRGFNGRNAPSAEALAKFGRDPRFQCVYDNGEIKIYRYLESTG